MTGILPDVPYDPDRNIMIQDSTHIRAFHTGTVRNTVSCHTYAALRQMINQTVPCLVHGT